MKRAAALVGVGRPVRRAAGAVATRARRATTHDLAAQLAALGVPAFACTPDRFPELMAAAIQRADLRDFAAK